MDAPYSLYTATSTAATTATKASSTDDDDNYCYSLQLPSDMAALLAHYNCLDNQQSVNMDRDDDEESNFYNINYYAHSFPGQSLGVPSSWDTTAATGGSNGSSSVSDAASTTAAQTDVDGTGGEIVKAKIAAHPLYPKLLQAYIDCHKVGAPAEMASLLDEMMIRQQSNTCTDISQPQAMSSSTSRLGADPELDDFMESYYEVLVKYKWEMWRPFDEATTFLTDIQSQFHDLICSPPPPPPPPYLPDYQQNVISGARCIKYNPGGGSSDEDMSCGEVDFGSSPDGEGGGCLNDNGRCSGQQQLMNEEERELKEKLIQKYGGYLSSLKQEFSKKKKKGKLPKEARLILLNWWNLHYKWPYPTEADKVGLAESTGLDQKQINNWFINQRKRHWKPTDNMQSSVLDTVLYSSSSSSSFFISDYPHHH